MKKSFIVTTTAATFLIAGTALAGVDITESFDGGVINTENGTTVQWSTGGNATWGPGSNGLLPGDYWESGDISNNQISDLVLDVVIDAGGGFLDFDYAVSSESSFDFFRLWIDGVQQFTDSGTFSGIVGPIPLAAGTRSILFQYTKDGSVSSGFDAAGIDNVHVTNVVPAPGALAILGFAGFAGRRRRRVA